ncbi:diguanylate cyclase [Thauera sp. WH-1]|uniref:GGDEF domain-containing protein n=1 Tax=Thauera sp. WH-1 TaxID=3398230 RepID=UPI0039FC8143
MSALSNPSEIARETLRQLAMRRVAPTPDNYRKLYHEIAGSGAREDESPAALLRKLVRRLPRDTADRQRQLRQLEQALADGQAKAAETALERYVEGLKAVEQPAWNEVIANLLRQWEARHAGWTTARKRESLDRVLNASDASTLYTRLQGLMRGWNQSGIDAEPNVVELAAIGGAGPDQAQDAASAPPAASRAGTATARMVGTASSVELIDSLRDLLRISLRQAIPALLTDHAELCAEARSIAAELEVSRDATSLPPIGQRLRKLTREIEITAADDAEVRAGLLELLRLLLRNIDDLVLDDQWLSGQVEMLREIVDSKPDPRRIDDAARRLGELISKQGQLKHSLVETQRHLREMLAGFVDQLARFSESTGTYHDRIGTCAQRIAQARNIAEIGPLLDEVMAETRSIQQEAQRSRGELIAAREQAREAESRVSSLQAQLEETSRLMRHDQLTGALNRRGLEEMFQKEAARAQRRGSRLAVALLDIDHFKKLNDTLGHEVGDDALVHLARIVRQHLRPQDVLARFGGEEFVILLPETADSDAQQALVRLQRELTREFFMADQQKVVITFSAGVTPLGDGESLTAALKRADMAMYQAKQAGRNRVVVAPHPATAATATATPAA